ncbi:MAG: hypothetical protein SGPRY_009880, partial [Prymnesium sp.]
AMNNAELAAHLENLRNELTGTYLYTEQTKRDKLITWMDKDKISPRDATDSLALAIVDELKVLLDLFEGAPPPRKKCNPASWAAKVFDACFQETERLEAEAERLNKEKPTKTVHHFCMNDMVPVLRTDMSLRLCIECAKTETPGILAQLEASQQSCANTSLIIRCAHALPNIVQEAQAKEAQPKTRHAVLPRAMATEKDQRIQMLRRLPIRPRNLKLGGAWDPHKVNAPLNAKYRLKERFPALNFAQRKLVAIKRDALDWKVRSLACTVTYNMCVD